MVRTNPALLNFITELYNKQIHKEELELKHYSKGETLINEEEILTEGFIIKEGTVRSYLTELDETVSEESFYGAGEVAGDGEFLSNIPTTRAVEAITDVTVYACTAPLLKYLHIMDDTFNHLMLETITQRIEEI